MKEACHVIEIAHTKRGYSVVSIFKTFFDGLDYHGEFKTGENKAYDYLRYLQEDTRDRTFEIIKSKYGTSL